MNRNKLKTYAPKARRDFIAAVTARAAKHGISKNDIRPMIVQGDVALIDGQPFPKKTATQRERLEGQIKLRGFDIVIEEAAYTWFNRFAAMRYMEVHGYFDHGYRVLSHPEGKRTPEIVEHADHLDLAGLDKNQVIDLKLDGTRDEELYRMLLIAQCNALHTAMPFLFERIDDETELLLPDNLLHSDSVIRCLVDQIDEADWQEIEVIGWLYQFYISEKGNRINGDALESQDIPAATQLFTPNWIVKYMIQNSLGAKWLACYPNSSVRSTFEYYIEPAEQNLEIQEKIRATTPKEINPDDLTLLDPACGSGHILVEAYDVFKAIYLERGFTLREVPHLILTKNLYGLDLDQRAVQLASFALLMKARQDDRRILEKQPKLNIVAVRSMDEQEIRTIHTFLKSHAGEFKRRNDDALYQQGIKIWQEEVPNYAADLATMFEDAHYLGSLIIPTCSFEKLNLGRLVRLAKASADPHLFAAIRTDEIERLRTICAQATILSKTFDVVVANPPYLGAKMMPPRLKTLLSQSYPASKTDLFACFIERALRFTKTDGIASLVTLQNWMFLSSFSELRQVITDTSYIRDMVHIGYNSFPSLNSKVALATAFTLVKEPFKTYLGTFINCNDAPQSADKAAVFRSKLRERELHLKSTDDLSAIPGKPIAYWAPKPIIDAFRSHPLLRDSVPTKSGQNTGDNNRFTRRWFEVDFDKIGFGTERLAETERSHPKWYPYNKGGEFRKWYGNFDFVINWSCNGREIKDYAITRNGGKHWSRYIQNLDYMLKEGITWTFISSSYFGARYTPTGHLFDYAGCSAFPGKDDVPVILGYFCSSICHYILQMLNPTLNLQPGNVGNLPAPRLGVAARAEVSNIARELVAISKADWDSVETSWHFSRPLLL
jgi:hypothetical protein